MDFKKFPIKLIFANKPGQDFAASQALEKWCKENGYSVGIMCSPEPRAVLNQPDVIIQKWKNLSPSFKETLDGVATSTNWRYDDVVLFLKRSPFALNEGN